MNLQFIALAGWIFFFVVGCEQPKQEKNAARSETGGTAHLPELETKATALRGEIRKMQERELELRNEISILELDRDETMQKLAAVDSIKKQLIEEVSALKKRWNREMEGLVVEASPPLSGIARSFGNKIDELVEENAELREKLKKSGE